MEAAIQILKGTMADPKISGKYGNRIAVGMRDGIFWPCF